MIRLRLGVVLGGCCGEEATSNPNCSSRDPTHLAFGLTRLARSNLCHSLSLSATFPSGSVRVQTLASEHRAGRLPCRLSVQPVLWLNARVPWVSVSVRPLTTPGAFTIVANTCTPCLLIPTPPYPHLATLSYGWNKMVTEVSSAAEFDAELSAAGSKLVVVDFHAVCKCC